MFQFRAFPPYDYLIHRTVLEYCSSGFPHSEISGSMRMCRSPKLFAACRVLHRLLMPRHSPCALISLTCRRKCLRCMWIIALAMLQIRFGLPPLRSRPAFAGLRLGKMVSPFSGSRLELCRSQKNYIARIVVVTLNSTIFLFKTATLLCPLLPCFFSFSIVQFSRCRREYLYTL